MWQKAKAYLLSAICILCSAVLCCCICVSIMEGLRRVLGVKQHESMSFESGFLGAVCCVGLSVRVLMAGDYFSKKVHREAADYYVPSARDPLLNLSADRVLLRGSQATAGSSDDLLRAAESGQTLPEELLRAAGDERC